MSNYCEKCGYPLGIHGCGACNVRKQHKLPSYACCANCKYKDTLRCSMMGPHSVCAIWKDKKLRGNKQ